MFVLNLNIDFENFKVHLKIMETSENEHWKTKIQYFLDTKNNDGQTEIRIKSYEQILQSLEMFLLSVTMFSTILLPSKSIPNHSAPLRSTPCTMQIILILLSNTPPLYSCFLPFCSSPYHSRDPYQEEKETPMESLIPTILAPCSSFSYSSPTRHLCIPASFHFAPALITPVIPTRRRRRQLWSL